MRPFLSLCMIVKNEQSVLERCLKSVEGIVDEMIIVDTGSTDATKEIARKYTEMVFDYEWCNDFSHARNFAASKANGEWILVLDADEYVDQENLKEAIEEIKNLSDKCDIYAVKIMNFMGNYGERILHNKHERIYKNNGKIKYYRQIHEQLKTENDLEFVATSSLIIYHSGYLNKTVSEKNKGERNKPLIEEEIKKNSNSGFDYFNLGNELSGMSDFEKALEAYLTAFKLKNSIQQGWVSNCLVQIINCLINLKRYEDALNVISDAHQLYGNSPDFPFLKGEIFFLQNRYDDAIYSFGDILKKQSLYTDSIISQDTNAYLPHLRLGEIYTREKKWNQAVNHYSAAFDLNKYCFFSINKLMSILSMFHSEEEVFHFFQQAKSTNMDSNWVIKVINIALNLGLTRLAELFSKNELVEQSVKDYVKVKSPLVLGKFDEFVQQLRDTGIAIEDCIQTGLLDELDLILLKLNLTRTEDVRGFDDLLNNSKINSFYKFLKESQEPKEEFTLYYLSLVEKLLNYNNVLLLNDFLELKQKFHSDINGQLANLLYSYGYEDYAISLYELAEEDQLTSSDYANIIQWLITKNEMNEAFRINQQALEKYGNDFRFYKYKILLHEQKTVGDIILSSLSTFKNSQWLEERLLAL